MASARSKNRKSSAATAAVSTAAATDNNNEQPRICSVEGCSKPAEWHGRCAADYNELEQQL